MEWRPRFDGNSPIRSFNLQYNKDYSGWQTLKYGMPPVENIPAEVNRLEVDKLDYASQYQFRIRAINDIGNSPWSDNSKTVTTHQKGNYFNDLTFYNFVTTVIILLLII